MDISAISSSTVGGLIPPSMIEQVLKQTAKSGGGMTQGHIFAWLLFGLIGTAAFGYGRKQQSSKAMIIGVLLMVYPYGVTNVWSLWGIGIGLTAYLLFSRN